MTGPANPRRALGEVPYLADAPVVAGPDGEERDGDSGGAERD